MKFCTQVDSTDPKAKATAGQFTDTANLERFELTMEEYENRTGRYTLSTLSCQTLHFLLSLQNRHRSRVQTP